jgi:hypothetical protein
MKVRCKMVENMVKEFLLLKKEISNLNLLKFIIFNYISDMLVSGKKIKNMEQEK